jgi:hypothetical protein
MFNGGATRLGGEKPAWLVEPNMPDETDKVPAVEVIPSLQGGLSAIGSANAPALIPKAKSSWTV